MPEWKEKCEKLIAENQRLRNQSTVLKDALKDCVEDINDLSEKLWCECDSGEIGMRLLKYIEADRVDIFEKSDNLSEVIKIIYNEIQAAHREYKRRLAEASEESETK